MRTTLAYDLPTRIFHGLFSMLFLTAFIIAKTVDDESTVFSYHMLAGILLGGLVLWRIYWGIFGSANARFSGFNLSLNELKDYFLGILTGSRKKWFGHNPASSWATIAMLLLGLGLAVTGYLMAAGNKESFEDLHEFLANSFIVVVFFHVAGVILHSLRHKDGIAMSMVDGKKSVTEDQKKIVKSHGFAALLLVGFVGASVFYIFKNFDPQQRTLQLFNQTLQLGENESAEQEESSSEDKRENDGDSKVGSPRQESEESEDGDD